MLPAHSEARAVEKKSPKAPGAKGVNMEGPLVSWLISLVTGAVGGNVARAIFKNLTLGTLGITIAEVVGGQILNAVMGSSGSGSVAGNLAGSGVVVLS